MLREKTEQGGGGWRTNLGRKSKKIPTGAHFGRESAGVVLGVLQCHPHHHALRWGISPILQVRKLRLGEVLLCLVHSLKANQGGRGAVSPPPVPSPHHTSLFIHPVMLPSCSQPINRQVITSSPHGAYQLCDARKCFLMPASISAAEISLVFWRPGTSAYFPSFKKSPET